MKKIDWDSLVKSISYIYLIVPFVIFALCWLKPYYGIPLCMTIIACFVRIIKRGKQSECEKLFAKTNLKVVGVILLIIVLWVCMSGIGGLAYQTKDHAWRNTLFEILIQKKWPVIQNVIIEGETVTRGISYYIGFWLPAAALVYRQ